MSLRIEPARLPGVFQPPADRCAAHHCNTIFLHNRKRRQRCCCILYLVFAQHCYFNIIIKIEKTLYCVHQNRFIFQ